MGIVVRQSVKSVFITVAGILLGAVVTVLSVRYFPKVEYGFTQNLTKVASLVTFLGLFGFNYAIVIHGQRYPQGHKNRSAFLTICALFPMAISILIAMAFFVFKDALIALYGVEDSRMIAKFLPIFPILTVLCVIVSWLSSYLQSIQKNALQTLGTEVLFRIVYIGLIACYVMQWIGYAHFIWLFLLVWCVPAAYLLFIAVRKGHLKFTTNIPLPKKEIKELVRFSGYHMLTAVSTILIFQLDIILIGPLAKNGFEAVAVYSVAVLAIATLRNPARTIAATVVPSFSREYKDGNIKKLYSLFNRSCINMQVMAFAILIFVFLNIEFIQQFVDFIKQGYGAVKWLILILVLGQFVDMVCGFNYQLISVSKYYRFNFWISLSLLLVVFILNLILIEDYGIFGAAWATTIGMFFFSITKSWFVWKKLKMQPISKKTLLIFIAAAIGFGIAWMIPKTGWQYLDLIIKNIVLGGLFIGLILKWKVSEDIQTLLRQLIKKGKRF